MIAAAAVFSAGAADAPWIDESIGTTGRAKFDEGEYVFTPFEPSDGRYVTVEAMATFPVNEDSGSLGTNALAAVCIWTNGCFQVWTRGNVASVKMLPIPITNSQSAFAKATEDKLELATLELATLSHWQH